MTYTLSSASKDGKLRNIVIDEKEILELLQRIEDHYPNCDSQRSDFFQTVIISYIHPHFKVHRPANEGRSDFVSSFFDVVHNLFDKLKK